MCDVGILKHGHHIHLCKADRPKQAVCVHRKGVGGRKPNHWVVIPPSGRNGGTHVLSRKWNRSSQPLGCGRTLPFSLRQTGRALLPTAFCPGFPARDSKVWKLYIEYIYRRNTWLLTVGNCVSASEKAFCLFRCSSFFLWNYTWIPEQKLNGHFSKNALFVIEMGKVTAKEKKICS